MAIKTTLFFPFNDYSFSLIDYVKKINGDFVVASCKGTGLIGKDVAYSVNMPDIGVNVLDIADVSWNQITDFVILNPGDNLALYKQIKKVYILAKENKITIHDLTGYFDTKIKQKKIMNLLVLVQLVQLKNQLFIFQEYLTLYITV